MEFFRFLKWQWNRFATDEQIIISMVTIAIITFGISLYLGFTLGASLLTGGGMFIFTGVGIGVFIASREQWSKYKKYRDHEAQMIVDKLRGR